MSLSKPHAHWQYTIPHTCIYTIYMYSVYVYMYVHNYAIHPCVCYSTTVPAFSFNDCTPCCATPTTTSQLLLTSTVYLHCTWGKRVDDVVIDTVTDQSTVHYYFIHWSPWWSTCNCTNTASHYCSILYKWNETGWFWKIVLQWTRLVSSCVRDLPVQTAEYYSAVHRLCVLVMVRK